MPETTTFISAEQTSFSKF